MKLQSALDEMGLNLVNKETARRIQPRDGNLSVIECCSPLRLENRTGQDVETVSQHWSGEDRDHIIAEAYVGQKTASIFGYVP